MLGSAKRKYEKIEIVQHFLTGLDEVRAMNYIPRNIRFEGKKLWIADDELDLSRFKNIYLAGSGKASIDMAKAMNSVYPGKFTGTLMVSDQMGGRFTRLKVIVGGHPYPTKRSFSAGKNMVRFFDKMELNDFFIYLLSGGSSALLEMAHGGLPFDLWEDMTRVLQNEGLNINELNTLRKKLSRIKNGSLGRMTSAHGIVLVTSDVIDNDLSTIGSAPFYSRDIDIDRIKKILLKYKLFDKLPREILQELVRERPKQQHTAYRHYILAYNKMAIIGAVRSARKAGYKVHIVDERVHGAAREVGEKIAYDALKYSRSAEKVCLVYGGETTVAVKGKGIGGRNQELVLAALDKIKDSKNIQLLSSGTDGIDGPTPAAGAYLDRDVLEKYRVSGLNAKEFLENNDSYKFFKKMKAGHIELGPTGTNVGDIMIAMIN